MKILEILSEASPDILRTFSADLRSLSEGYPDTLWGLEIICQCSLGPFSVYSTRSYLGPPRPVPLALYTRAYHAQKRTIYSPRYRPDYCRVTYGSIPCVGRSFATERGTRGFESQHDPPVFEIGKDSITLSLSPPEHRDSSGPKEDTAGRDSALSSTAVTQHLLFNNHNNTSSSRRKQQQYSNARSNSSNNGKTTQPKYNNHYEQQQHHQTTDTITTTTTNNKTPTRRGKVQGGCTAVDIALYRGT